MHYLLGIDFGGGASKATLLTEDGRVAAEHTVEYPTLHPAADRCEQNPDDWQRALNENIRALLDQSGADPAAILAVAIDSATHTAVLCGADFRPLRPAIHWTDSRSRAQVQALRPHEDEIVRLAFHRPDTIWTLPQLIWVRENEPEVFAKTRYLFFEKDYLRYLLTGVYCTDYIEAEGSMLFDCRTLTWSDELCALAGIDKAILPPIVRPTDRIGGLTAQAAAQTGLVAGTPVICGSTDTVMEVFASGAVQRGDLTVKLATAGRICVITDRAYPHPDLINYSHIADGLWYPGTATKSCAASYRWFRDTFGGAYRELDGGAEQVPVGCEGLMFHPYLNGELTPYADPLLCGSFTGIRANHTKAHFARAVMEGVVLSLLDCKRALDRIGIPYGSTATVIGGGAKGKLWRQMTADALGLTLNTTESSDSSLGSAMLAGIAAGVFADPADAVRRCIRVTGCTTPQPAQTAQYDALYEKYKRIHDALAPVYHEFSV